MAYVAIPHKGVGETVSATEYNVIADDFVAGVPDIFTTKGDIAIATAADAASRLGVGTNNFVLIAASGEATGAKWAVSPTADLVTTKGDILAATAADTLARLAAGANGSVLVAASGEATGLAWVAPVEARYEVSETKALTSGATTILDYDTSVSDTDSAVTTGAGWKFTCPAGKGGVYMVIASCLLQSSAAWGVGEYINLQLFVDGAGKGYLSLKYMEAAGTYNVFLSGMSYVVLAEAEELNVRATHNSGSEETVDSDADASWIQIIRLGAA